MGIAFGLLGNLGLPSLGSLTLGKLEEYFKEANSEEKFLCAVINLCSDVNAIMPGKHYTIDQVAVKNFYNTDWSKLDWSKLNEDEKKKAQSKLVEFMINNIKEDKPSSFAMISIGCAAPFGAIALKKSGEKVPQVKKFRIDLVPNFVIVPTITLLSVIGVRIVGLNKGLKPQKK